MDVEPISEQPCCPKCSWDVLEEDRTVPGQVYTVCARCGAFLAMRSERRWAA
jgi:hypothetical protein